MFVTVNDNLNLKDIYIIINLQISGAYKKCYVFVKKKPYQAHECEWRAKTNFTVRNIFIDADFVTKSDLN